MPRSAASFARSMRASIPGVAGSLRCRQASSQSAQHFPRLHAVQLKATRRVVFQNSSDCACQHEIKVTYYGTSMRCCCSNGLCHEARGQRGEANGASKIHLQRKRATSELRATTFRWWKNRMDFVCRMQRANRKEIPE